MSRQGQASIESIMLLSALVAGLVAMGLYIQRGMQGGRNSDGIAVQTKPKSRNNRHFHVTEPEARGDRDRLQSAFPGR